MVNSRDSRCLGKFLRFLPLAPILLSLGCRGLNSDGAGQRPLGFHRRAPRVQPAAATIGRDLHAVPAGTTVPAAGLGVDLVKFEPPVPPELAKGR